MDSKVVQWVTRSTPLESRGTWKKFVQERKGLDNKVAQLYPWDRSMNPPWMAVPSDPESQKIFLEEFDETKATMHADGGLATPKRGLVDGPGSYSQVDRKLVMSGKPVSDWFTQEFGKEDGKPKARFRKLNKGPNKGKWVRWYYDKEGNWSGYMQGKGENVDPKETLSQFKKRLKADSKQKESAKSTQIGRNKIRNNVDNWTNKWIDENIDNYGVKENNLFKKDMANAWTKELKTNPDKYKYQGVKFTLRDENGLPKITTKDKGIVGRKPFSKYGFETHRRYENIFFDKVFAHNKIKNNPELKKSIKKYMDFVAMDKAGFATDPKTGRFISSTFTDAYKKLGVTGDALHLLGPASGLSRNAKQELYRSFDPAFFKSYTNYIAKKRRAAEAYTKNVQLIQDRLYPNKKPGFLLQQIRNQQTKEINALKKIFDVSRLPEELDMGYSLDHPQGIARAAQSNNPAIMRQSLNQLIGMTSARNTALGFGGFSQQRNQYIKNINQGKNVKDNLKKLNKLTSDAYSDYFKGDAYTIKNNKVVSTGEFNKFKTTQPQRFKMYFEEIYKTRPGKKEIIKQHGSLKNLLENLCPNKASGGRVGMKVAGTPGVACGADRFKQVFKDPSKGTQTERQLVGRILRSSGSAAGRKALYALGPAGIGIDALIEGAIWGDDVLKGASGREAYNDLWISYLDPTSYTGGLKVSGDRYNETEIAKTYGGDTEKFFNLRHAIEDKYRLENKLQLNEEMDVEGTGITLSPQQQNRLEEANTIIENAGGEEAAYSLLKEDSPLYDAARISSERFEEVGPGKQWDASWLSGTREPGTPRQIRRDYERKREMDLYPTYDKFITPSAYRAMDLEQQREAKNIIPQANLTERAGLKKSYAPLGILPTDDLSKIYWTDTGMSLLDEYNLGKKWNYLINQKGMTGTQDRFAGGGIAGVRRPHAIPPKSGPMPQGGGLSSMFNRVRKW